MSGHHSWHLRAVVIGSGLPDDASVDDRLAAAFGTLVSVEAHRTALDRPSTPVCRAPDLAEGEEDRSFALIDRFDAMPGLTTPDATEAREACGQRSERRPGNADPSRLCAPTRTGRWSADVSPPSASDRKKAAPENPERPVCRRGRSLAGGGTIRCLALGSAFDLRSLEAGPTAAADLRSRCVVPLRICRRQCLGLGGGGLGCRRQTRRRHQKGGQARRFLGHGARLFAAALTTRRRLGPSLSLHTRGRPRCGRARRVRTSGRKSRRGCSPRPVS